LGRVLDVSTDGLGGGGIIVPSGARGLEASGTAGGLLGNAGLCSPVIWGDTIPRPRPFASWLFLLVTTEWWTGGGSKDLVLGDSTVL
jgi:hypothetical protein